MIHIIDFGSQVTHNIARRIRELGTYTEIIPYIKADTLQDHLGEGLILSGGQYSVYDPSVPSINPDLPNIPILGICYGQQWLAYSQGGKVNPGQTREYGKTKISISRNSPLFTGLPREFNVWMSHGDVVEQVPPGYEVIAVSENGHIAAMQNLEQKVFGVQFHPEVDNTEYGREILKNFDTLTGSPHDWNPGNRIDEYSRYILNTVGDGNLVVGVSGGVDSSALGILAHRTLGERAHLIFINNGLLRKNEEQEVIDAFAKLSIPLQYVDASERFLTALRSITNPDEKRKIIGHEFIYVFQEIAQSLSNITHLGQGTLYPDVIESVPIYGSSSTIKRHHNVGGLPESMHLQLVEPFSELFKDEVRVVATELGLPIEIVGRHPFPGPGLAVRCIGEVTPERLEILRNADAIFIEELHKRNLYKEISQALAYLTDTKTVGVMGDAHTYQYLAGLRAVVTKDFMTADAYPFPHDIINAICSRIINEVKGINRIVYDHTQKPPGTIEPE